MTLKELSEKLFDKFIELRGDRVHGETEQVRCGLSWIDGQKYVLIFHNHRCINELSIGYRKSLRILKLAEILKKPVLWWEENTNIPLSEFPLDLLNNIDENIRTILNLEVPIIGIFSSSDRKSSIITRDILDDAIILADKKSEEKNSGSKEFIIDKDLSSLKTLLIDKCFSG